MPSDWERQALMFSSCGLHELASDALRYGREEERRRREERALDRAWGQDQKMVREMERRMRQFEEQQEMEDREKSRKSHEAELRAANVSYSDLPREVQHHVDGLVSQSEPETLYTMEGEAASGRRYECTSSMYEEIVDGMIERTVVILIRTDRAAGEAIVTYQQKGSTWTRVTD